jgi:adenylate cyclase
VPLIRDQGKARLEAAFVPGRKSRTVAVGPGGQFIFNTNGESVEESARRSLESCGATAGVPCMIVAVDDVFVVPVPALMKAMGFFRAANSPSIIANEREESARKLGDSPSGWNAVAVGTTGRPGVAVKASSEQSAINDALGDCAKRDSDCHVIAIGPFVVGPNN